MRLEQNGGKRRRHAVRYAVVLGAIQGDVEQAAFLFELQVLMHVGNLHLLKKFHTE